MEQELKGKVAVITGASRGIGKAIALAFATKGARLVLASRNKSGDLEVAANEVRKMGASAIAVSAHVAKIEDLDRLVAEAQREFGRIDILVNNAGINPVIAPIVETEERTWDNVININLKSVFILSQRVAKIMMQQKEGCIINLTSVDAFKPEPGYVVYAVSKAGLVTLTKGMAREFGQYGIRVNAVAPGLIITELTQKILTNEEFRAERIAKTSVGRLGVPGDVVSAVLFLVTNTYVTGHTILVDGGKILN